MSEKCGFLRPSFGKADEPQDECNECTTSKMVAEPEPVLPVMDEEVSLGHLGEGATRMFLKAWKIKVSHRGLDS